MLGLAFIRDAAMDALLQDIDTNVERLVVTSAEPANYAAVAGVSLADVAVDGTDITLADGDTSGRKFTMAAQTGFVVDTTGTASHVVLVDDTGTSLLHSTALSATQALTAGNTVDTAAYDHEVADPT